MRTQRRRSLPLAVNETLKMALIAAHLVVVTVQRYRHGTPTSLPTHPIHPTLCGLGPRQHLAGDSLSFEQGLTNEFSKLKTCPLLFAATPPYRPCFITCRLSLSTVLTM